MKKKIPKGSESFQGRELPATLRAGGQKRDKQTKSKPNPKLSKILKNNQKCHKIIKK